MRCWRYLGYLLLFIASVASATSHTWNNPHQGKSAQNTRFGAFSESPKTLDPARAYSSNEMMFIEQIYEPPLQYHYLKRPYTLEPLTAVEMPLVTYYNKNGHRLPADVAPAQVAYTVYDITIKPGIVYQPHPALAKNDKGQYVYHHLSEHDLDDVYALSDFKQVGTREATAEDYVYQIKRLAHPDVNSPIYGLMSKHIVGLQDFAKTLQKNYQDRLKEDAPFIDLRKHPIEGVKAISRYRYQITIKGVYPQFKYWLAMPFFSPMPWEADLFYAQPGMKDNNITLDWYPIGTGPYTLAKNNPNKEMVLARNPNFRQEFYPTQGSQQDKNKGYLQDAGQQIPFVDKFIFSLDKESIPRWNKFLQGYYDYSGIAADSFDQAIKIDKNGQPILTDQMKKKGIRLQTSVSPSVFYIGFNMLDDIVGGNQTQSRKLRQAISIALDYEEYISIFMNGRGIAAHSPLPPGIFGYQEGKDGINEVVYDWDGQKATRKPLAFAKKLLAEAGYPGGINPKTNKPLILNYDATSSSGPDDKARLNWMRKQFAKLGIQLNIRATQYNRFRDKVRQGNAQIFSWGWLADYPDPENFLFLLHGPNGKVKHNGENATNYDNPKVDQLFDQIKNMANGAARQDKINQLLKIIQKDSPWIWGMHPIDFSLSHQWNRSSKPNPMARNTLKYERMNPQLRTKQRANWNKPATWPLWLLLCIVLLIAIPLVINFYRREHRPNVKRFKD